MAVTFSRGAVLGQQAADFAAERIRFVRVVSECDDPAEVQAYGKAFGLTFPIHLDPGFRLAAPLGATVTPEVVLVDRDRRIRYSGRIDDRYKIRHGNDLYRNIVFPLNRAEDLRLRAIQFLPGNRKVVHHALIGHLPRETAEEAVRKHGGRAGFGHPDDRGGGFQDPHGIGFRVPPVRDDGQPRAKFISGFVPGVRATVAPADAAIVIPAGCDLSVQAHYVRTGKLETDSSRLGIWLDRQPPRKVMNIIYIPGEFAVVPHGVTDFRVHGGYTLPQDADMVGVVPHAHRLARWIEIKAYPPHAQQPLLILRVPQWDYNWQASYDLEKPRRFPAGTRFEAEASYDNSAANPRNPFDPPQHVWHNESTNDEMLLPMFTFASATPLDGKGESFGEFIATLARSRFLRRLVDHRFKYVADPQGNVVLAPDYDPDDHRY